MEAAKRSKRELFVNEEAEADTRAVRNKDKDPVTLMRCHEIRRTDRGVHVACEYGVAVQVDTSKEPNRRGQRYFTCLYELSRGEGEGCGLKRLMEEALLEEVEKINEEKEQLEKHLEEAHKRIDSQEGRIYEMYDNYAEMMADRKQVDDYGGELFETCMGLASLTDKHDDLVRRVEVLEKRFI